MNTILIALVRWCVSLIVQLFGKLSDAGIVEESLVDPHGKQFITYTRNFTSKRLLVLEEKCTYMVSPENSDW